MKPPAPENDLAAVIEQVRANIAFEHMLVAVLAAAAASAGAGFVLKVALHLASGVIGPGSLLTDFLEALTIGFTAFLVGFAASVVIGAPLFVALEKNKLREPWPYYAAAVAVEIAALWLIQGRFPIDVASPLLDVALFFPGLLAAFLFTRSMRPVWEAAERAEQATTVVSLH